MKEKIIKICNEVADERPYKQAGNADSYSSYNEGWSDACDILEQRLIEQLLTTEDKSVVEPHPKLGAEEWFYNTRFTTSDFIEREDGVLGINLKILFKVMEQYAQQQDDGWVSVEDRLPDNIKIKDDEPDELKLILDTDEIVNGFYADGTWWLELGGNNVGHHDIRSLSVEVEVLYWKKLPKPPKSNE